MNKIKKNNIVSFPTKLTDVEREIEAIVFAAAEPLSVETIESKLSKQTDIQQSLEKLKDFYSNRGINLICISNKWSFRTAVNLSSLMSEQKTVEKKLSRAAIETLAIIVYHQPVTRSEIEEIRGVAFGTNTLEILMELNWVKHEGRKNVPGKPIQYGTTDEFLSHFNLQKLSDLPTVNELGSAGLIDTSSVDSSIFGTGKFFKEKQVDKKENIYSDIDEMLDETMGEIIRDGFKIAIIGPPNAGKSSFLNLLVKRQAAIVSSIKGTTRDLIEGKYHINNYPVILTDTAGIRNAKNKIEKTGVELAINASKEANLDILILDGTEKKIPKNIQKLITEKTVIVLNKKDKKSKKSVSVVAKIKLKELNAIKAINPSRVRSN